jgi:hypothetical protein
MPSAGVLLCLSRQEERSRAGRLPACTPCPTPAQDAAPAWNWLAAPWRRPMPPSCSPASAPAVPRGKLSAPRCARPSGIAAGQRHHRRRSHHLGPDALGNDRWRAASRPDHAHRRRHRPRPAQRRGRRHCLPGSAGDGPDRRRHGDVHHPGACGRWRAKLNVTSIIFNNASYSVLNVELERVGASRAAPRPNRNST